VVELSCYYSCGTFCNKYGTWADDVVEETGGENDCNGDCDNCEDSE